MKPTLYWLGAGKTSSLELNPANYQKIVLVEAQSGLCDKLRKKYQSYEHVEIINTCLVIENAERVKQFNVFNVSEFSSSKSPTGLKGLFPGLQITKTLELEVSGLQTILGNLEPELDYELIIDLPDLAGQIIDKLSSVELLQYFKKIMITCGTTSLYEDALNYAQIMCVLEKQFFEETSVDDSDPDILVVSVAYDHKAKMLASLEEESIRLKQMLEEEKQKCELLEDEREQFKGQSETLLKENEKLKKQCESASLQNSELNQQLSAKVDGLKVAGQKLDAITAQLETLNAELAEKTQVNKSLEIEVASLTSDLDEQRSIITAFRANCQELSDTVELKTECIRAAENKIRVLEKSLEQHSLDKAKLEEVISYKQLEIESHIEELQQTKVDRKLNDEAQGKLEESLAKLKAESETSEQQWAQTLQKSKEKLVRAEEELESLRRDKIVAEEAQGKLEESLTKLKAESKTSEQQWAQTLQKSKEELARAEEELESLRRDKIVAEEAQGKLAESLTKLKAESEASEQQLAQTLKETQETLTITQEELERLRQDKQADEVARGQLEESLAQIKQEKQEVEERLQSLKDKYKALEQYNEALKRKVDESNKLSIQHSATLELTTKQNMKLHIDLDELRNKYAEKVESETSLKELIAELHEKLQQAANFYRKLESSNPELLGGNGE